jgi:hypothetical protein
MGSGEDTGLQVGDNQVEEDSLVEVDIGQLEADIQQEDKLVEEDIAQLVDIDQQEDNHP